jgi:PadR family transcriptional regulator, regulatory protein PadR
VRRLRAGWVDARWEEIDAAAAGRPARRYYRLTRDGVAAARTELAALHQYLSKASGTAPESPRW